ncbi:MAG TPA: EamA family transporter, partial [Alphaproteobacteria bacterium]|nr:EamA family transporter [Alphaproteobacteria bacterium]
MAHIRAIAAGTAPKSVHLPTELALLVLLSFLWGGSFTLIKIAVETIPPASMVAVRVTGAAVLLLLVARWRELPIPSGRAIWGALLVQGLLQSALPFTLIGWGEMHIDSGLAGVLNATPPIFVFLITLLVTRHERIDRQKTLGVMLGMIGVAVVIGAKALRGLGSEQPLVLLAILGASLCYAVAPIWARRFGGQPALVTAAGAMTCAALVMAPVALVVDRPWTLSPSPGAIVALGLLSVFSTALAMVIFFRLLRTLGALGTSSGGYLRAGFSVVLGIVILG